MDLPGKSLALGLDKDAASPPRLNRLRKKSTFAAQPLKGRLISNELAVSLKRYPDTKLDFFETWEGLPAWLPRRALQLPRRRLDQRRLVLQRLRDAHDLLLRFRVPFLFDPLTDSRNRFHSIAGVHARSVEQMLVPGTPRQSVGIGQAAFAFDQLPIHGAKLGRNRVLVQTCLLLRQCLLVVLGAASKRVDRILHGRKVQVRRNLFPRRGDRGTPGIKRRLEHAFI